jgi:hypothetical protein
VSVPNFFSVTAEYQLYLTDASNAVTVWAFIEASSYDEITLTVTLTDSDGSDSVQESNSNVFFSQPRFNTSFRDVTVGGLNTRPASYGVRSLAMTETISPDGTDNEKVLTVNLEGNSVYSASWGVTAWETL